VGFSGDRGPCALLRAERSRGALLSTETRYRFALAEDCFAPRPARQMRPAIVRPPARLAALGHTKSRGGFTLVEFLVVFLIVGLLAGLVLPRYLAPANKSDVLLARAQVEALGKALEQYRADVGSYPTTDQGLEALISQPEGLDRWQGPYTQKPIPTDPWGRPYQYKSPGEHDGYDLFSYGADGKPGGTGENVDIVSWQAAPPNKTH